MLYAVYVTEFWKITCTLMVAPETIRVFESRMIRENASQNILNFFVM